MADTRTLVDAMLEEDDLDVEWHAERHPDKIGAAAWGTLLLWAGIAVFTGVGWTAGLLGAGVVFLAAEAIRRLVAGRRVERLGIFAGLVFIAATVASAFFNAADVGSVACLVVGIALVADAVIATRRLRAPSSV